jgi:hypothetical protein
VLFSVGYDTRWYGLWTRKTYHGAVGLNVRDIIKRIKNMVTTAKSEQFVGNPWYGQYQEVATGKVISGYEIREYISWTKLKPNVPRYARITKDKQLTTYLDSELVPVEETLLTYQSLTDHSSWSYPFPVKEVAVSGSVTVLNPSTVTIEEVKDKEPEQVKAPLYAETRQEVKRMDGWLGHELQNISESLRKFDFQKVMKEIEEIEDRQDKCCILLNDKLDTVKADVDSINATITTLQQTVNTLQTAQQTCCDGLNAKLDTILSILEEPPAPVPVSFDVTLTPA